METQVQQAATQWAVFLVSFSVGAFFFDRGMHIRLGRSKQYFLKEESGLFGTNTYHFFAVVGGIFMMLGLIALAPDFDTRQKLIVYVLAPCLIAAFLIGLSRPSWLKSCRLEHLERNHPDVYPLLGKRRGRSRSSGQPCKTGLALPTLSGGGANRVTT